MAGHECALFIGRLPQKSTDVVVRDYNKHTKVLFSRAGCQQARSRSLLVGQARQIGRRKGQTHQHPSPPQTAAMGWADLAVPINNRDANKGELHQSKKHVGLD